MSKSAVRRLPWPIGALLVSSLIASGCYRETLFSESLWNPFGLDVDFVHDEKPVRLAVEDREIPVLDPATWCRVLESEPWGPLRAELSKELKRPVQISPLKPFQIEAHLNSGRLQFALLSAEQYTQLKESAAIGEVLAVADPYSRRGLIVASSKSTIQNMADLVGKRFAFGPADDPVLDRGAVLTLETAGVTVDALQKEILPIPGGRQFHISSREAAKAVVYELGTEAGVIEESEFESFPETGGRFFPLVFTFSKDQFRVLGRTDALASDSFGQGYLVAGSGADPDLTEQVRQFLLSTTNPTPPWAASLGLRGFTAPPAMDLDTAAARATKPIAPVP